MSDCEIPEFWNAGEVVARKEHRCCECQAPIQKGERHTVCSGKWDGEVSSYRQHTLCALACEFFRDHFAEECLSMGELKDYYREWWGDHYAPEYPRWKREIKTATIRNMMAQILRRERLSRQGGSS